MSNFKLESKFKPSGSQPEAIAKLIDNLERSVKDQILLGVTGSGKTFTVANVISKLNKPALVIAHNKTLAAQLTQEFRDFFPNNAVEYFVSYYDYYQPEAYLPNTDTYIEKEATVNDEIDRLRNSATQSILTRQDCIVVASVSCIYGLGSPEFYQANIIELNKHQKVDTAELAKKLLRLQFTRIRGPLVRGSFNIIAGNFEIMPTDQEVIYQIILSADRVVEEINVIHPINRDTLEKLSQIHIFPAKHYLVPDDVKEKALEQISEDLEKQLQYFRKNNKIIEAERLNRRTKYDLEMIREVGYCNGIENYSRYFDNRLPGSAPFTLVDYFKQRWGNDFLLIIDESHVTIPQIGAMYEGDKSRKNSLVEYGFRLPAAKDNRPLKFEEFEKIMPRTIYVSATPSKYEKEKSGANIVEQIVRPTGLIDPEVEIKPTKGQIDDLFEQIGERIKSGERTLVTTLTKKMAEDLTDFLKEKSIKVNYLHSEVETIDRIRILEGLRRGEFDVLIGVNLLREGLDLPEVSLVAILDADKEGFLRSQTSLIQTVGRAARNINGKVIFYADQMTGSIERAIEETNRRREIQLKYNKDNGITPQSIQKEISSIAKDLEMPVDSVEKALSEVDLKTLIKTKEKQMKEAAVALRFEEAAILRDQLLSLKKGSKFFNRIR